MGACRRAGQDKGADSDGGNAVGRGTSTARLGGGWPRKVPRGHRQGGASRARREMCADVDAALGQGLRFGAS